MPHRAQTQKILNTNVLRLMGHLKFYNWGLQGFCRAAAFIFLDDQLV
jgi:hypothetical protein